MGLTPFESPKEIYLQYDKNFLELLLENVLYIKNSAPSKYKTCAISSQF